jgi:hypothetical protein
MIELCKSIGYFYIFIHDNNKENHAFVESCHTHNFQPIWDYVFPYNETGIGLGYYNE